MWNFQHITELSTLWVLFSVSVPSCLKEVIRGGGFDCGDTVCYTDTDLSFMYELAKFFSSPLPSDYSF